jgi:hypothetical protein
MPSKQIITYTLLVFVVASLGYLLVGKSEDIKAEDTQEPDAEAAAIEEPVVGEMESPIDMPNRRLIAYYFHGNVRCPTCRAIEEGAHTALQEFFPSEIESGSLEWKTINTDEVWNSHYVKDFELVAGSVVVAEVSGAATVEWKNLHKVWQLVHDKEAYFDYIRTETQPFLERL